MIIFLIKSVTRTIFRPVGVFLLIKQEKLLLMRLFRNNFNFKISGLNPRGEMNLSPL